MTLFRYKLPSDLAADIDAYEDEVKRFVAGDLAPAVFKARRVPRGIYEQRKDGTFMLRVRAAAGVLDREQARELAELGSKFGNGLLHVTTRQDVQLHDVSIENTPAIMRRLMGVGLTSKGGGGNTVRNVTACPYAGICPAERFDVTPCSLAVTEYLIALAGSYNLPRKYKIAFSGCSADCALAQAADLGFIAETRDGKPGFRVLAGGGMGAQSRIADVLMDWAPARDVVRIAETMRRLFDRHGDRRNKHRARLRFVFERLGVEAIRNEFAAQTKASFWHDMPEPAEDALTDIAGQDAAINPPRAEFHDGIRVIRQRQPGYYAAPLHLPLGFLPAADFARIGEFAARYSAESGMRATRSQNLLLRFMKSEDLRALAADLRSLETDVVSATPLDRFVACAGASTCRLGICLARNAARACADALAESGVTRDTLDDMEFHINGCPNACGHQPVAAIGFFGAAGREGDRLVPSYGITLGGRCGAGGAEFGIAVGKIPARALPGFARDLAKDFQSGRGDGESFPQYFDRIDRAHFETMTARHAAIPSYAEHPDFYRDIGAEEEFSLAGRGAGECGAGVFEVVQEDLSAAKKADAPFDILLPAARALLITRGVDARDPDTVLREFEKRFIDAGLVSEEFRPLLSRARGRIQGWQSALDGMEDAVTRLRERVELLYSTLDANLEFHPPDAPAAEKGRRDDKREPEPAGGNNAELDLTGVACPMNFVKAKLRLETMDVGAALVLLLDDGEPVRNVPASFRNEGQEVAEIRATGDGRWRVTIRKMK